MTDCGTPACRNLAATRAIGEQYLLSDNRARGRQAS
jgi:hypothetical protein